MQSSPPQPPLHVHLCDNRSHPHWLPPQSLFALHVHDDSDSVEQTDEVGGFDTDGIMLMHTLSCTGAPEASMHCTTRDCVPGAGAQLRMPEGVVTVGVQAAQDPALHATMADRHMKRLQGRSVGCKP